jgi:FkbM family methyltransferase
MKKPVDEARIALARTLKTLLSRVKFRGKGRILTTICPKQGELTIPLFGYDFACDLSEGIQRHIFLFNYDEHAEQFIRTHLQPGDTFLDIGANVGFYSLLAASIVGATGRVIAVEPNPKTYSKLKTTIETNNIKNIVLLNIALGKERGSLDLYSHPESSNDTATMVAHDATETVKVEVFPLDEVASSHGIDTFDYLKIDVDGFEPDIFAGAKTLLAEGKIRMIQSEFCDYWLRENGSDPESLHHLLTEAGFEDLEGAPKFLKDCNVDRFLIKR